MPKRVLCFFITWLIGIISVPCECLLSAESPLLYSVYSITAAEFQPVTTTKETDIFGLFFLNHRVNPVRFFNKIIGVQSNTPSKIIKTGSISQKEKDAQHIPLQEKNKRRKKSSAPQHKKYVQIKTGPTRVLEKLSPDSPILGMANRGSHYPLLQAGESWCTIIYNDQKGWIERQYVAIVDAPSSLIIFKDLLFVGAIIGVILLLIFLLFFIANRRNKVKSEWFSTSKTAKKIIIVSQAETQVQRLLTDNVTPLEKCFTEIGFDVKNTHDSHTTMKLIFHYLPDAIAVDWQMGSNTQTVMEQILASKSFTNNIFVLFYNVPDPANVQRSRIILNAQYLGISFTDRDLFHIITPLIITGEKKHTIRKSIEASALQGNISESNLSEVFQFAEIGKKTGCLLIEDEKPSGIVYFNDGIIIYAATRHNTAKKAVLEILNFQSGQFYFVLGREPKSPNCSIPTLAILMEWTKETDETSGNRLRQA